MSDPAPRGLSSISAAPRADEQWQRRLLPLMVQVLIAMALFFFVVSLVQLTYMHNTIRRAPEIDLRPAFEALERAQASTYEDRVIAAQLKALAIVEAGTIQKRYHQTNTALMARVWTRYMGFVTGMILALLGAIFVVGKLQDASSVKLGTSPGIVMVTLGVVLMIVTIYVNHPIEGSDAPSGLRSFSPRAEQGPYALPDTAPDPVPTRP